MENLFGESFTGLFAFGGMVVFLIILLSVAFMLMGWMVGLMRSFRNWLIARRSADNKKYTYQDMTDSFYANEEGSKFFGDWIREHNKKK